MYGFLFLIQSSLVQPTLFHLHLIHQLPPFRNRFDLVSNTTHVLPYHPQHFRLLTRTSVDRLLLHDGPSTSSQTKSTYIALILRLPASAVAVITWTLHPTIYTSAAFANNLPPHIRHILTLNLSSIQIAFSTSTLIDAPQDIRLLTWH
jgi:hypothetical protein